MILLLSRLCGFASEKEEAPQMFLDADLVEYNKATQEQLFRGNVVAITVDTILFAEQLNFNNTQKIFQAKGHVLLIHQSQLFAGEYMEYNVDSSTFLLRNCAFTVNDPQKIDDILHTILGFSQKELIFELSKAQHLKRISDRKKNLQDQYQQQIYHKDLLNKDIVENYALLLEKEEMMKDSRNSYISTLTKDAKSSYQRRREIWEKSKQRETKRAFKDIGYFSIVGDEIRKIDANTYGANRAFFTPCLCRENESPAWGFRTHSISAKTEGYADLLHPILEIKGIPILYLPYLKIPLKTMRQSGFLLPNIANSKENGNMYSQSIYLALSDTDDATITADMIEKRGLRLGVNYRFLQREYSGWELSAEAIRDQAWLEQAVFRRKLSQFYQEGLNQAVEKKKRGDMTPNKVADKEINKGEGRVTSPTFWNSISRPVDLSSSEEVQFYKKNELEGHLASPDNSWRGKVAWTGLTFLSPRISIQSSGVMMSDHRYLEDLYIPSYNENLEEAVLFTQSQLKLHADMPDFYFGIGSALGDSFLTTDYDSNYQIPIQYRIQTRLFDLYDHSWFPTLYGQLSAEQKKISRNAPGKTEDTLAKNTRSLSLGNGSWTRFLASFNSPLLSAHALQSDFFGEYEIRQIEMETPTYIEQIVGEQAKSERLAQANKISSITTPRLGLHFGLPMDGKMPIRADSENSNLTFLEHKMNYDVTFSYRPFVGKTGPYGTYADTMLYNDNNNYWQDATASNPLTYFISDKSQDQSDLIPPELLMNSHQMVLFSTSHDWFILRKEWVKTPGNLKQGQDKSDIKHSWLSRAKKELESTTDLAVHGVDDIFARNTWFVNRYDLIDSERQKPLHFDSQASYDLQKVQKRKEMKKDQEEGLEEKKPLPEPWSQVQSNLLMSFKDWNLAISSKYHLYSKILTELNFMLAPPETFASSIVLNYNIGKELVFQKDGTYTSNLSRTRSVFASTKLFGAFVPSVSYGTKSRDNDPQDKKMTEVNWLYQSKEKCWGLRFNWKKDYDDKTWDGTYFMALMVEFVTQKREFGNLTSRYNTN